MDIFPTLPDIFLWPCLLLQEQSEVINNDLFILRWGWSGRTTKKCLYFRHFRLCGNQAAGVTCLQGFNLSHNLNERAWDLQASFTRPTVCFQVDTYSMTSCIWEICKCMCMFTEAHSSLVFLLRQDNQSLDVIRQFCLFDLISVMMYVIISVHGWKGKTLEWEKYGNIILAFSICPFSALFSN